MTTMEGMEQFHRLELAGYFVPRGEDGTTADAFEQWYRLLREYPVDDVSDGLTALMRGKTDRSWPTIGQIRGAIAGVTSGRERAGCGACGGSGWVEARPFKANGDRIYEAVERCGACGKPAPRFEGPSRQTPLSAAELHAWEAARRPVRPIMTRAEMFAQIQRYVGRAKASRPVALPAPSWHHPDERQEA